MRLISSVSLISYNKSRIEIVNDVYADRIDTWAYPWTACVWYHGGLTATPNVNLVSNIGFGVEATHTTSGNSPLAEMNTEALGEICHPSLIEQDVDADRYVFDHNFGGKHLRLPGSLLYFPRRVVGSVYRRVKKYLSLSL
jgi:hypothetical protein